MSVVFGVCCGDESARFGGCRWGASPDTGSPRHAGGAKLWLACLRRTAEAAMRAVLGMLLAVVFAECVLLLCAARCVLRLSRSAARARTPLLCAPPAGRTRCPAIIRVRMQSHWQTRVQFYLRAIAAGPNVSPASGARADKALWQPEGAAGAARTGPRSRVCSAVTHASPHQSQLKEAHLLRLHGDIAAAAGLARRGSARSPTIRAAEGPALAAESLHGGVLLRCDLGNNAHGFQKRWLH